MKIPRPVRTLQFGTLDRDRRPSTMNAVTRILIILILGSLTGIAGWWTLFLREQISGHEQELVEKQEAIEGLERVVRQGEERIGELDAQVTRQTEEIEQLGVDLEQERRRVAELTIAKALLKVDHRVARLEVVDQHPDPDDPDQVVTTVRFVEVDSDGNPMGAPVEAELAGSRVYLETLVIKFRDDFVEGGDALKGTSVCLFQGLFSEGVAPSAGVPIDSVGQRPHPYRNGDVIDPEFDELWSRFWDYAGDPDGAAEKGVRSMHGEAPFVEARPGRTYRVELRASGGLTITPE